MSREMQVTVLGGGSWGTTVASIAAFNTPTTLWTIESDVVDEINERHTNSAYLGQRPLTESLRATGDLEAAVAAADVLIVGLPSHATREVLERAAASVRPWIPIVSLAKGLEPKTRLRPTQVIQGCLPGHSVGLLAGPNIAREVLEGYAAAAVIAIPDGAVAAALQPLLRSTVFRVYRNTDVLGCELGGVLKNIVAIASGMADGLGVGDNTRSMVITRGLNEMSRLAAAMGADPQTLFGLTGLGDLLTTCMSPHSRNRRVGEELAKGKSIETITEEMSQVAEGVKSARTVMELAAEHGLELPIAAEVDAVVNEGRSPQEAYRGLLRTSPEHEHDEVA